MGVIVTCFIFAAPYHKNRNLSRKISKKYLQNTEESGIIFNRYGSSKFMVDSPKLVPFLLLPKCPQMTLHNP